MLSFTNTKIPVISGNPIKWKYDNSLPWNVTQSNLSFFRGLTLTGVLPGSELSTSDQKNLNYKQGAKARAWKIYIQTCWEKKSLGKVLSYYCQKDFLKYALEIGYLFIYFYYFTKKDNASVYWLPNKWKIVPKTSESLRIDLVVPNCKRLFADNFWEALANSYLVSDDAYPNLIHPYSWRS